MKTIHLIRYAKSSWDDESLADIDRPLNQRGIRACRVMAPHIRDAGCRFDHVFCSPAVRARSTIELLGKALPDVDVRWQIAKELYTFESDDLLAWCRKLDESFADVVIIGHNPALTDFCHALGDRHLNKIPTCGYVRLAARRQGRWQEFADIPFEVTAFLKPRQWLK